MASQKKCVRTAAEHSQFDKRHQEASKALCMRGVPGALHISMPSSKTQQNLRAREDSYRLPQWESRGLQTAYERVFEQSLREKGPTSSGWRGTATALIRSQCCAWILFVVRFLWILSRRRRLGSRIGFGWRFFSGLVLLLWNLRLGWAGLFWFLSVTIDRRILPRLPNQEQI